MMNMIKCYEYVELWDHVKVMMKQVLMWFTWMPYYDMAMMWWSHYMMGCNGMKFSCNT